MTPTPTPTSGAADLALRLRNACASVRSKSYPLADLIPLMQQAADALASAPAQPTPDERRLRRHLCATFEHLPYMDDGEAQGQSLDWLRCTVDQIDARIREVRLERLASATAQPAAQQGVAYAALPDEGEPWRGHKFKEVQRGCWRCDCGKTIKEVTSDQSTPASGGNYPVMPKRYTVDDDGEELFTAEKMRAFADATYALRASHGQAPAGATKPTEQQILEAAEKAGLWPNTVHSWIPAFHRYHKELAKAQPAQARADSVLEDAARYRWLREGNDAKHGAAWHVAVNLYGCEWDAAIDAAMNKGATQ